jgi:hypothetical protein
MLIPGGTSAEAEAHLAAMPADVLKPSMASAAHQ